MTVPGPRTVAVPRLLHVSKGCLGEVAPLLAGHDFDVTRVLVGCGPGPSRMLAKQVCSSLRSAGVDVLDRSHLAGRLDQAATLAGTIIEEGVTVAVAVGGGRVIDTVKLAAARTGIDFISVPTTISNDGISSPVASLASKDGTRASHAARMPSGIVVDVAAVGSAPRATLTAGVGDLASNLTACLDWRLADSEGHDKYDAFAAIIAESAARPTLDLEELDSTESHEVVAQGLLLSGLAMATAGTSRPCSGAEHLFSHSLDFSLGSRAALHGHQVALGSLMAATAHSSSLHRALRALYVRLGMPTTPEQLGITRAEAVRAVIDAPSVRPDRWTILSERFREPGEAAELVAEAFAEQPGRRFGRQSEAGASTAGRAARNSLSITRSLA